MITFVHIFEQRILNFQQENHLHVVEYFSQFYLFKVFETMISSFEKLSSHAPARVHILLDI